MLTPDMRHISFTWLFWLKSLDVEERNFLHKARFFVHGESQSSCFDHYPGDLYARVASHKAIRMMFALAAASELVVLGEGAGNSCSYGNLDAPIIPEQPIDSSGWQEYPGHFCRLSKLMYGLKQVGNIQGSLLIEIMLGWGLSSQQSRSDSSSSPSRTHFLNWLSPWTTWYWNPTPLHSWTFSSHGCKQLSTSSYLDRWPR